SDYAMYLAKKALLRKIGIPNFNSDYAKLEKEILEHVNQLGIGPEGFGGLVTALAVHIEYFPCHIASLPVGINLQCHSARVKEAVL
ncbi:MAG: fumarate hydratase, partial [Armatimonadetes bacterium]|nr:fumarate hydratase [Armatimonadota bacterium]